MTELSTYVWISKYNNLFELSYLRYLPSISFKNDRIWKIPRRLDWYGHVF